jgi:hypothetical protein
MKKLRIPKYIKNRYQHKTKELIVNLNSELEGDEFLADSEVQDYLNSLRSILDVGERHKCILMAFAESLTE